ncbi:HET-domain-containing protein [Aspergillus sclerotiicarbonarius CBS 121057]|uniref:HET-domain-containing protein n=1 Tax=Aspergillus sclerotiicarbonarius (strain CBS 121057 / IBT 28362) TaxID=1448318 RepID=A0A319ETE5_ASPSB|nr:HET-domain-containing protein [Aspergillus sclerotiicarbonarius CBS 121057]
MRLLRTRAPSLDLVEVGKEQIESGEIRYAILSHRWGDDEITFQDIPHLRHDDEKKKTQGYQKIKRFCKKVADHFEYAWIDTCCINKDSSTELSEAINSMFRWYKRAGKCYAYLNDVSPSADQGELYLNVKQSRWFERGWTLQELIAPSNVMFLAKDWSEIGCRKSLSALISQITLIDESVLQGDTRLARFSIAKKMSWASGRVTTRREDIAYCLMGIFDVSMPLLYGEGEKAFIRLQEEIMKDSDDQTLFAWENSSVSLDHPSGLLARSPMDFRNSGNIIPFKFSKATTPFSVTNRGIRLDLPLLRAPEVNIQEMDTWTPGVDILALECRDASNSFFPKPVGIKLRQKPGGHSQFLRVHPRLERNIHLGQLYYTKSTTIYAEKTLSREYVELPKTRRPNKNLVLCLGGNNKQNFPAETCSNIQIIHELVKGADDLQNCYYGEVSGNGNEHVEACVMSAYKAKYFSRHPERIWNIYQDWYRAVMHGEDGDEWDYENTASSLIRIKNLREKYSEPTDRVAFLGLFDTAMATSDLGAKLSFHAGWGQNHNLPSEISHPALLVRHAVSLDERRIALHPILVGDPMFEGIQDVEQVWFLGSHAVRTLSRIIFFYFT